MTRELSDRIGDVIGGAAEIRANDTARYELADASARLGRIYGIRLNIYKRKFFVKFLNNFLAQITPFFFYAAGGYFVIMGELSLGALVAVLAAYKDIIDPWKELLKWYETKEDVRIKYEQVVSQFEPPAMLPPELTQNPPNPVPRLEGPLVASGVSYVEDGGGVPIERLTLDVPQGQHVAIVGIGRQRKGRARAACSRGSRSRRPGGSRSAMLRSPPRMSPWSAGGSRSRRATRTCSRARCCTTCSTDSSTGR